MLKRCCKCKQFLPVELFGKCKTYSDGLAISCKPCLAKIATDPEVKRKRNEKLRALRKTEAGKAAAWRSIKKFRESENGKKWRRRTIDNYNRNHPERAMIHTAISNKLKRGEMVKQPCRECGEVVVDAHHEDYSKPFDVIWLCRKHHNELHLSRMTKNESTIDIPNDLSL